MTPRDYPAALADNQRFWQCPGDLPQRAAGRLESTNGEWPERCL